MNFILRLRAIKANWGVYLRGIQGKLFTAADAAHAKWQNQGASAYWAMSDQMVNGITHGSRYYPRGIATALWLNSD